MSDISSEWNELRPKIVNFICRMDGINARFNVKLKKLQEKEEQQAELQAQIDETYNKGLKDLHEAFRIIAAPDGITTSDLKDTFGICSVCNIILGFTPEEIIDKVNQWKAEKEQKEQELRVGDEVTVDNDLIGIIIDVNDDGNGTVWVTYRITPEARGLDFCWAYRAKCKKTGRHFDSIPFDYNPEKEE